MEGLAVAGAVVGGGALVGIVLGWVLIRKQSKLAELAGGQAAEIERLEAEVAQLHADMEAATHPDPDRAAGDLDGMFPELVPEEDEADDDGS